MNDKSARAVGIGHIACFNGFAGVSLFAFVRIIARSSVASWGKMKNCRAWPRVWSVRYAMRRFSTLMDRLGRKRTARRTSSKAFLQINTYYNDIGVPSFILSGVPNLPPHTIKLGTTPRGLPRLWIMEWQLSPGLRSFPVGALSALFRRPRHARRRATLRRDIFGDPF